MNSTEVVPADEAGANVTLFAGATPREIVEAATLAADALHDVIEQRQLSTRIGNSEHVSIGGWTALGALTGVFAVEAGGVQELPWPLIPNDGLPGPPDPGPEPRRNDEAWPAWKAAAAAATRWEEQQTLIRARDKGLVFGYKASFTAVKGGVEVGWGESRCARSEENWLRRKVKGEWRYVDDFQLASMAQTRAQSKALRQPLGFVVALAGYSGTPAEELDGAVSIAAAPAPMLDEAEVAKVAGELQKVWPDHDAFDFMRILARRFGDEGVTGIPEAVGVALKSWAWWVGRSPEPELLPEPAEPEEASQAPETSE